LFLVWWSVSAGADSLAHRRNNAQKTIGMIWGWVWLTAMKSAAAVGDKSLHLRTIITYYLAIGDGTPGFLSCWLQTTSTPNEINDLRS